MHTIKKDCLELTNKINFDQLRDKSILVTGASGIVGSYMIACLSLIQDKYNIKIYAWIKNDIDPMFIDLFKKSCYYTEHGAPAMLKQAY